MPNFSAVLYGAGDVRVEDRPVPIPGARQVLVEIDAVGICGSDVHYYEHGRIGKYVVDAPMVIGHESSGVITAVGADVPEARIGQRVALEPGVPDYTCAQCLAGRYNLCPNVRFFATPPVDGSIARVVAIDSAFAHEYPSSLSPEQAAMAEPVSVGVWAAQKAAIAPGDRVLVTGAGPIGLLSAQVARAFGASSVTVTDVSEFRLGVARDLGLLAASATEPITGEFDVLVECSGSQAAVTSALPRLAPAARVVLVGMGTDSLSIDVPTVQGRELTISGIFRYANTYPVALALIANGLVDIDAIVTHHFALGETEDALTLARRDPRSLKAIVLPRT